MQDGLPRVVGVPDPQGWDAARVGTPAEGQPGMLTFTPTQSFQINKQAIYTRCSQTSNLILLRKVDVVLPATLATTPLSIVCKGNMQFDSFSLYPSNYHTLVNQ